MRIVRGKIYIITEAELDGSFEITVRVLSSMWMMGLPHVERSTHQQNIGFADPNVGCVTADVSFHAGFESPNFGNDELFEHVKWAEQLSNELRINWDWDTNAGPKSDNILHTIQTNLQKLLDRN